LLEIRKCYAKWAHSASNRAPSDLLEAQVIRPLELECLLKPQVT
jgi:hypothetical protein